MGGLRASGSDMEPGRRVPGRREAARGLLLGEAAAAKGLREDLRGAAVRPWRGLARIPKQERPRREEEAAAEHEFRESGNKAWRRRRWRRRAGAGSWLSSVGAALRPRREGTRAHPHPCAL